MFRRQNVRIPVLVLGDVYEPTTNELITRGRFLDLSAGGALLKSDKPIEKNHIYNFRFEVKDRYKFVFYGVATHVRAISTEKKWFVGIQFQCTQLEQEKLDRIINSIRKGSISDLEKLGVY